ncbi:MAG: chemotaxis protein CheW [Alphaproteobacteria bacterium]
MNSQETDTSARGIYGGVEFITASVGGQMFGIRVLTVQDVLGPQKLARVPLAPPAVAGALNMRGRIVTAIDLRQRLGLPAADREASMSIVVEFKGELYSLLIDEVGEVLAIEADRMEPNPPTLKPNWREVSSGIYRLDGQLMVVLEVDRLLDFDRGVLAA